MTRCNELNKVKCNLESKYSLSVVVFFKSVAYFFATFCCRYDFKGVIDYVFFTDNHMNPLGVLGPLDKEWFKENKVVGCPHPHIPSDHFSLLVEFELPAAGTTRSQPPPRR